jgi:MFS transporter, ACS family, allantoate permease
MHGFSIAPWKIVFLLTGILTVAMGILFLICIPDNQLNASWLSEKDKIYAIERVRVNQQGIGNKHFKMYQFKEALLDPMTWAFFVFAIAADVPNGGLSNFFSQLIVSFGFTSEESLLYGTPAGAVEVIALLAWGWMAQQWGNRLLLSIGGFIASIVGSLLIVVCPLEMKLARLLGYYLTTAYVIGFVAVLSLISSNVAGYGYRSLLINKADHL